MRGTITVSQNYYMQGGYGPGSGYMPGMGYGPGSGSNHHNPAPSPPQTYEVTFTGSDGSNGYYVDVQDRMGGSMGALNSPISVNEGDVIVFKKTFQGHPLMVKDSMTGTQFFQAAIAGVGEERWTAVLGGPFEYYCTVHPQMRGTITVSQNYYMQGGYGPGSGYMPGMGYGPGSGSNHHNPAPSPPQTYEVTFTGSDGSNGYYVDVQDRMGGSMGALNSPISVNEGDVI